MLKRVWPVLFAFSMVALIACGGGGDDDDSGDPGGDGNGEATSTQQAGSDGGEEQSPEPTADGGNGGAGFDGDVCSVIPDDVVADAFGGGEVESIENEVSDGSSFGYCTYLVDGGATGSVSLTIADSGGGNLNEWTEDLPDAEELDLDGAEGAWVPSLFLAYVVKDDLIASIAIIGGDEDALADIAQQLAESVAQNMSN